MLAWNLGDIPPGLSAHMLMSFQVSSLGGGVTGMPPTDPRHSCLRHSLMNGSDVFYNRGDSLKISHWIDNLLVDVGSVILNPDPEYEEEYLTASDVSVFFNTRAPGEKSMLHLSRVLTNGALDKIRLTWNALDVIPYQVEYSHALASNDWAQVPGVSLFPPVVPTVLQWEDDGTVLTNLPVQTQPHRFYRLVSP